MAAKNTRIVCMCRSHSQQNVEMLRKCDLVYIWIAIESDAVTVLCSNIATLVATKTTTVAPETRSKSKSFQWMIQPK